MKTVFKNGDVELAIRQPSAEERTRAQIEYNKAVKTAIETGHIMRARLDNEVRKQGLWTDEMEKKDKELLDKISKGVRRIQAGDMKLSEAKSLAITLRKLRAELISNRASRNDLDNITAEAFGEQARFDYLVSVCTVYNVTGEPFFKGVEDYKTRSAEEVALLAASKLASSIYNLQSYEESLPENKFLKKFKFVDDKFRLVNKEGKLVDEEGRLINEDGRYIDEEGNFVNIYGEKVDENGDLLVDSKPFLDDDGNPIE